MAAGDLVCTDERTQTLYCRRWRAGGQCGNAVWTGSETTLCPYSPQDNCGLRASDGLIDAESLRLHPSWASTTRAHVVSNSSGVSPPQ